MRLILGDSLEKLKELDDNSVDSIVTDPPAGIGFMGKEWDTFGKKVKQGKSFKGENNGWFNGENRGQTIKESNKARKQFIDFMTEIFTEALRTLKPGGHALVWALPRTSHWTALALEDAGFEIRDCVYHLFGSGFPKSLAIGKAINKLETNEWSKIIKAFDNVDQKSIMEVWIDNSSSVKSAGKQSEKSQTETGICIPERSFALGNVVVFRNEINTNSNVDFAVEFLPDRQANNQKINTALQSVEVEIKQLLDRAKSAGRSSQSQNRKLWSIFTAECDVKEWLKENTEVNHKVDEALKTLRGNQRYSNEEITNVLCVALTAILKLTILSQSNTFQNLDTKSQTDFLSAINVIITGYTAENLISNTVDILKSKAIDKLQGNEREVIGKIKQPGSTNKRLAMGDGWQESPDLTKGNTEWEGWGTALKPAVECWWLCRKPLSEKSIAENVLKWGTGGINIDESRVEYQNEQDKKEGQSARPSKTSNANEYALNHGGLEGLDRSDRSDITGRFPANLIHDNSEEVRECFPETKSGAMNSIAKGNQYNTYGKMYERVVTNEASSGNASRFFKSIIYQAKPSKSERNKGLENIKNHHPTVKAQALMGYLVKLITPPKGVVLDPFMGSGSTGIAAKTNGFDFIGIELEKEYYDIAEARINAWVGNTLFK